jgi:purine-binding chemotaxis protein CheW
MNSMSDNAGRLPAEEHVSLLRRRAAALAREEKGAGDADARPAVVFELAGERYAIDAGCVLRVLTLRELTPLPGAAAPLFGVTHWRGSVLTLLDIRPLLGALAPGITDLARVVVLEGRDREFGIVVDRVRDLVDVSEADVRPLPDRDEDSSGSLLSGILQDGTFVVDAMQLLARHGTVRRRNQGTG